MSVMISLSTVSCGPSRWCCRTNLFLVVISFILRRSRRCRNIIPSLSPWRSLGIFLKNNKFLVMELLWFCATTFDPFTTTTVYGVQEKCVDNLFHFVCLTRTLSPSLIPLNFVTRRSFVYPFPTSFYYSSFVLASQCRFNTLEFRVSVGIFPFICLLYRSCAAGTPVVERGVDR